MLTSDLPPPPLPTVSREGKKKKGSIDEIMRRRELLHQVGDDSVHSGEFPRPQILGANERNFMAILRWGGNLSPPPLSITCDADY